MVVMSSPAQWLAVGKSWDNFIKKPSGTGPFKMETYVPRERAVLARNKAERHLRGGAATRRRYSRR